MSYASTQLDLKIIILNEISQTEKDKYNMAYFTYMWNLKYDRNKHIYETGTDSQAQKKKCMVTKGERGQGSDKLGLWDLQL